MIGLLMMTSAGAEKMTCVCPASQYVRVRQSPSRSAAEWGMLHAGDVVDVEGAENGYIRFMYDGRLSYARASFFEGSMTGEYLVRANGRVARRKNRTERRRDGWNQGTGYKPPNISMERKG